MCCSILPPRADSVQTSSTVLSLGTNISLFDVLSLIVEILYPNTPSYGIIYLILLGGEQLISPFSSVCLLHSCCADGLISWAARRRQSPGQKTYWTSESQVNSKIWDKKHPQDIFWDARELWSLELLGLYQFVWDVPKLFHVTQWYCYTLAVILFTSITV